VQPMMGSPVRVKILRTIVVLFFANWSMLEKLDICIELTKYLLSLMGLETYFASWDEVTDDCIVYS
jgi:hypothetical protein